MLHVSLLGRFSIRSDDRLITDINTTRLQSLLAYLLLNKDTPQSREHLSFLFWPETSETQARTNLRNLLHHLRHSLPDADIYIETNTKTIQWRLDSPFYLDVDDFESALMQFETIPQHEDTPGLKSVLEQAISIYKGDLFPGCYEDWIISPREVLRQKYINAMERFVYLLENLRKYPEAIQNAQHLLRYDPLQEGTYRQIMRLYALLGDRAGAIRMYHTCTTTLQRELQVEPSRMTESIYQQILGTEPIKTMAVPPTTAFSFLVGRDREWLLLLNNWHLVISKSKPSAIFISGEAGIGKTRLVEELLQWATRQGIANLNARCYSAEGQLAYAPVTTWLRSHSLFELDEIWLSELARLIPELLTQQPEIPQPSPLKEPWQRKRLFEALSRAVLSINNTILLIIDDLQWCDKDTLEWLHFLMRFDQSAKLLLLGTYRQGEIMGDHPLVALRQSLQIEGQLTEIELGPLDEIATKTLASSVAGMDISEAVSKILFHETEGNPFFVVETARVGLTVSDKKTNNGKIENIPNIVNMPPRIQSLLTSRLAQLSTPAQELAGLAATIGREFKFQLLAAASGREDDELVRYLDELWQRRIIRETGIDGYDFSHDKLREAAYAAMSTARRRMLHLHTAQALETLHFEDINPFSYQIASHYERAGKPEQAIAFYLRASEVAHQVYANEEAIALLRHGISLVKETQFQERSEGHLKVLCGQMWETLGDILNLTAQHDEALNAYQHAQANISQHDHIGQARLYRKTGYTVREQRLYDDALVACQYAENALSNQSGDDTNDWWDEWLEVQVEKIWVYYWLGQWPEMEALINQVQPIVQARAKVANHIRFLIATCLLHLRRERYTVSDEMIVISQAALTASQEWGNVKTRVDCQFELGFLRLWRRELDVAEKDLLSALDLSTMSGIVPQQTLCLTYLTAVYRFKGDIDKVSEFAHKSQELAQSAHMPDYVAAAQGNQAWLAWRNGDLFTSQRMGKEALAIWQRSPLVYPFQWIALWPLIGIAKVKGLEVDVYAYIKMLLEPNQQRFPENLNKLLEATIQTKSNNMTTNTHIYLNRAVSLAQEMGYL